MIKQMKRLMNLMGFRPLLICILLVTGFIQFFVMLSNVRGDTYDIELMQLAPDTIRATKTVEDTVKTERERDEAAAAIEPIYEMHEETAGYRANFVKNIFDIIIETRKEIENNQETLTMDEQTKLLRENLQDVLNAQSGLTISDIQLASTYSLSTKELISARDVLTNEVTQFLSNPIRQEDLTVARNEFESKIRQKITNDNPILSLCVTIGRTAIVETELLDADKLALAQQQARDDIEETKILQGQVIVQKGINVDRETYRQLELLGIIENKTSNKPIIGLAIFITLQMIFMYLLFERTKIKDGKRRQAVIITVIVFTMTVILMKLISLIADNLHEMVIFAFPTALATMLVLILVNERIASVVTILVAASAGVIFQGDYAAVLQMDIALYIIFGGFAAILFMRIVEKRAHLLQVCGIVTVVNLLFIAFYLLMLQTNISMKELVLYIVAAIVSGLLSGALTIGLLPFFESAFGILSTMRLIELSNPNHPLLKKVLTETPGTYHHSVMVANLAEAACEAIDADGLLARVGCYYHDVGKTRHPHYFIENQHGGKNPHDDLSPEESAKIILAHTTDGAKLLREHKMPKEIVDIALQHHGTSVLKYFIYKAKEQGKEIDERVYTYAGPKPQTKEAAVISIADSVEAAVRSIKEPTPDKVLSCIQGIIQDRVQNHQFDECDISLKELKMIEKALSETLNGIFHSRIEYPKEA